MLAPEEMAEGETLERAIEACRRSTFAQGSTRQPTGIAGLLAAGLSERRAKAPRSRIHRLFNSWSPGAMVGRGRWRVPVTATCSVDAIFLTVLTLLAWAARDSESAPADHSKGTSLAEVLSSSVDARHLGMLTRAQGDPRSPPDDGLTGQHRRRRRTAEPE